MHHYNYKCLNCGHSFVEYARNSYTRVACPNCKSKNVQKKSPNSVNTSSTVSSPSSCG